MLWEWILWEKGEGGGEDVVKEGGWGIVEGGDVVEGRGGDIVEGGGEDVMKEGGGGIVEGGDVVEGGGEDVVKGGGGDIVEGGDMTVGEYKVAKVMELVELPQVLVEV